MTLLTKEISPGKNAIHEISDMVWQFTMAQGRTPLIVLSTAGPIDQLRKELERSRPVDCPLHLVFLPKILSSAQWLEQTPGLIHFPPVKTHLERWEKIYAELAKYPLIQEKFGALGEGSKWSLVKAIVQACDVLTQAHISFTLAGAKDDSEIYSQAQQAFERALEEAYPEIDASWISAEGNLILAFWRHLSSTQDPLVREIVSYQLRTRYLKEDVNLNPNPMIWVEMAEVSSSLHHVQMDYLKAHAIVAPVLKISMDWSHSALWPECLNGSVDNWSKEDIQTIERNRQQQKTQQWRVIGLPSFEKMAWGAVSVILHHIQNKRFKIALIAQDRLVARRIRALLDRLGPQLQVIDQTGWKLSTTSAASAVQSYLELMQQTPGPSLSALLGFLKNPLLDFEKLLNACHLPLVGSAGDFAWFMESTLLSKAASGNWLDWVKLFEPQQHDDLQHENLLQQYAHAQAVIQHLRQKASEWQDRTQSSRDWVEQLRGDLRELGLWDQLEQDDAGLSLIAEMDHLAKISQIRLRLHAWVSLWDLWLEQASFVQKTTKQPVTISIIPLSSIRLQSYEAVVMVGCDERQLPTAQEPLLIFSREMLKKFDEKLPHQEYIQQARDLSQLLCSHDHVDLLWQEFAQAGEVNRLSPWLTRLQIEILSLQTQKIDIPEASIQHRGITRSQSAVTYPNLLPTSISPSAYQILRSCPYRFFVSSVLQLKSPKALRDFSEFGMIGTLLHDILKIFYRNYKKQHAFSTEEDKKDYLQRTLTKISEEAWEPIVTTNGQMLIERDKWLEQIPGIVDWQIQQEESGWEFVEAEKNLEFALQLANEMQVMIQGRADRIDQHLEQGWRVWDYKFKTLEKIKESKKNIEDDPQLLIYAQALKKSGKSVKEVGWITLRDPKEKSLEILEDFNQQVDDQLHDKMTHLLNQVWGSQALPANGPSQVCKYCDARGICRKGMWQE
jgi:ATP-dependent helicase/nuclease subunit B